MKYDPQKAFPYPVLRPCSDDFGEAEFQTTVDFVLEDDTNEISVEIIYSLSSDDILRVIKDDKAEFISLVCCRDTYFRKTISSNTEKIKIGFESGLLRGEVSVLSYIAAKSAIKGFSSVDINDEFGKKSFDYTQGAILAQDETQIFYIDRDLFKPITSVFDLVKKETIPDSEWILDFEQEHIQIAVNAKTKEKIDNARNSTSNKAVLLNSLYFAAVMQTIQVLKDSADYDDYKWAKVFRRQAHNMGYDLDSMHSYLLTERLLKHPLSLLDTYVFKE